jgi:hypothetical protein
MFLYKKMRKCIVCLFSIRCKELSMITNLGGIDRLIRLLLGLGLAAAILFSGLSLFAEPLWFWGGLTVSAILIITAIVRFCPLYAMFHVSTRKVSR